MNTNQHESGIASILLAVRGILSRTFHSNKSTFGAARAVQQHAGPCGQNARAPHMINSC